MDKNLPDSGQCHDEHGHMHVYCTNVWVEDETRLDDSYESKRLSHSLITFHFSKASLLSSD